MDIARLAGLALCGVAAGLVLRSFGKKEYALLCEIACGILMLCGSMDALRSVLNDLAQLQSRFLSDDPFTALLFKVTGIALIAELAAQLCRDAGSGALAQKVELAAKGMILCSALPMLSELCSAVFSLLD